MRVDNGEGWGRLVGARDGGRYAGDRIIVADCGRMAAVNVGGLSRPSSSAAVAVALGMSMHLCWHKGGAGRGGCGGGGVPWCHLW